MVNVFDFIEAKIVQLGEDRAAKSSEGVWPSPLMTISNCRK